MRKFDIVLIDPRDDSIAGRVRTDLSAYAAGREFSRARMKHGTVVVAVVDTGTDEPVTVASMSYLDCVRFANGRRSWLRQD